MGKNQMESSRQISGIRDGTMIGTLAPSYITASAAQSGAAAVILEDRKTKKYYAFLKTVSSSCLPWKGFAPSIPRAPISPPVSADANVVRWCDGASMPMIVAFHTRLLPISFHLVFPSDLRLFLP